MPDATLHIDELRLRLPGVSAEEARRLAEAVARDLATRGVQAAGDLGALDLRLTLPADTPPDQLARRLADAIARRLA